ncbi:hypothetical protein IRZ83_16490 [Flavobacterium sp. JLP]|uniref:hypothetical protein n=1 Tax=Flavobacterium sp. JLP TaxID=2783793 RepID=UPI00188B6808|nr:hypothetical protein [Flavobacterium sp. JLP]MBF4508276.1 hypothetical protein [Flavobacterium sp. JLP]
MYLESANASSFENPTLQDLDLALEELKQSDEEHGAFWIVDEDENVLEIHKDKKLKLFFILAGDSENQIVKQLNDINKAKLLFIEFLTRNIERLRNDIESL